MSLAFLLLLQSCSTLCLKKRHWWHDKTIKKEEIKKTLSAKNYQHLLMLKLVCDISVVFLRHQFSSWLCYIPRSLRLNGYIILVTHNLQQVVPIHPLLQFMDI